MTPTLIKIECVLKGLQCGRNVTVDETTVAEVRQLLLHLEQNPSDCTPEGRALCEQFLEVYAA